MHSYEDYFTKEAIIGILCEYRLAKAKSFHDKRFLRKIFHQNSEEERPALYDFFPSRKTWHRFRPKKHNRSATGNHTLRALKKAISWHERNDSTAVWLLKLNECVDNIRLRALFSENFVFSDPDVRPEHKKGHDYRAISSLSTIEDKVIDNLNAKYLRESLDITFENSSVAFRGGDSKHLDRNYAINRILAYRSKHPNSPLFVTECDIRGFFDCVHHTKAKNALDRSIKLLQLRNPRVSIDPRAQKIFNSYLNCFSFSNDVKKVEEVLKRETRDIHAVYKWPLNQEYDTPGPYYLKYFHKSPSTAKIGIPQGGAHSCLIANIILDIADKETLLSLKSFDEDSLYLRFCDDIIIITQSEEAAKYSFEAYTRSLEYIKLPYHKPVNLNGHGKAFFENSKTKVAFKWNTPIAKDDYPWIQFLGYQIRYDNYLRVRPSSIKKHKKKIHKLFVDLQTALPIKEKKVSSGRAIYRFNSKIWAFSSGRVNIYKPHKRPLPMCWCNGFGKLADNNYNKSQIRDLDRHVGKYRRRMKRYLRKHPGGEKSHVENKKTLKYYGAPFSHQRQFNRFQ